ncbi:MAG: hypothetical protein LBR88_04720 [Zoogloeaceae bacterium]|nr:hypothetical protein [Zoogloeaceae bacterium]
MVVILGVEGNLRWIDHLDAQEKMLAQLRNQKSQLRAQVRDKAVLEVFLKKIGEIQSAAKTRLWVVPSEAVGQARQKDWIQALFQREGIRLQSLVLATPRADAAASAVSTPSAEAGTAADIREFRATLTFPFSPNNLEKVLGAIEGSSTFARIESLRVNRRQRRIELEFAVSMEIDPGAPTYIPAPVATESGMFFAKTAEIEAAEQAVLVRENGIKKERP